MPCNCSKRSSQLYLWLLFDADGTLFDYERAERAALTRALEGIGIAFRPEFLESYRRINGELWQALERGLITPDALKTRRFQVLFDAAGISHPADSFADLYLACLSQCSELLDGASAVVTELSAKYKVAIVTNGLRAVQRERLARSTIRNHVSALLISEEIGHAKPAREFFVHTFARLQHPPKDRVLMIGDNWSSDIVGAAQFGIDTCWFNPRRTPRPPEPKVTREIASLRELVDWLS